MKNFFYPTTICIAGASSKPASIGYELLHTIKSYGFTGNVFPVNPKADEILGYRCFSSVSLIDSPIDLAFIVVPKQFVESTVDELLTKGVKAIVLITAGFKETGEQGREQENRIAEKIRAAGARFVGPNCMGLINSFPDIHLNATFVAEHPIASGTGFLSQSGALGAAVINSLRTTGITFGHFISVGNKADINENDVLAFWLHDDRIKTIAMYLESFANGEQLLALMNQYRGRKPVVILKGGRKEGAMRAAASHTGALAASDTVVDAVFRQAGIIRAQTIEEMFSTLQAYEQFPLPGGNAVAVLTNAGGPAILAVDALEAHGLTLAALTDQTKAELRAIVHPEGSINNPVDLLPGGTAEQFTASAQLLLADPNVNAVISIFVEPVMVQPLPVVSALEQISSAKPLFQVVLPLPEFWQSFNELPGNHKVLFRRPEDPAAVIANLLFYRESMQPKPLPTYTPSPFPLPSTHDWIPEELTRDILKHYHIPLAAGEIFKVYELEERARDLEYPVVLKGLADHVTHKSELNFVRLNIKTPEDLIETAIEMLDRAIKQRVRLPKFLIQRQIGIRHELLIGATRDPSFGPVVMFGSGGKYVEVLQDRAIRSAHSNESEIEAMIAETRIGKILSGVRGEKSVAIPEVRSLLHSIAKLMLDNPRILELDLNPVILTTDNTLVCVDARIRTRD
jgi:acetyltransferase